MSKAIETGKKTETPANTSKLKNGKKLTLRSPFVTTHVGMYVHGKIELFGMTTGGKFGAKETVTIILESPCEWTNKKTGEVVRKEQGDAVRVEVKPGLQALTALPVGTLVEIRCTGTVDTGKGNPAYSYEVTYE